MKKLSKVFDSTLNHEQWFAFNLLDQRGENEKYKIPGRPGMLAISIFWANLDVIGS